MKGILWYVTQKLEGIFDGILMEFHMRILEDKNQIKKSMYIPRFLSSGLYGSLGRYLKLPIRSSFSRWFLEARFGFTATRKGRGGSPGRWI